MKVFGNDMETLQKVADEIEPKLTKIQEASISKDCKRAIRRSSFTSRTPWPDGPGLRPIRFLNRSAPGCSASRKPIFREADRSVGISMPAFLIPTATIIPTSCNIPS